MNPLVWLFVVAPAAALAALIFLWVYKDQSNTAELQREQHRASQLEFNRDFAAAWNGERIETPNPSELERSRARVAALEERRDAESEETCKRLAQLAEGLEGVVLAESGQPSNCTQEQP